MDPKYYELLNRCARLLQEEELATTYYSKRRARLDYEKEYRKLKKYRMKEVV